MVHLLAWESVANSNTAVCFFRSSYNKPVEIWAFGNDGNPLWSSMDLSSQAYYSEPMIDSGGGVTAAVESRVIRFDSLGGTVWSKSTVGGTSPTLARDEAGHTIIYVDGSTFTPASENDTQVFDVSDMGSSRKIR